MYRISIYIFFKEQKLVLPNNSIEFLTKIFTDNKHINIYVSVDKHKCMGHREQTNSSEIHLNCPSIPPLILHRNDCLLTDNHQELAKKKSTNFQHIRYVGYMSPMASTFFFQKFSSTRKNIFTFQNIHTVSE